MNSFKRSDISKSVRVISSHWNDTHTELLIGKKGRIKEVHPLGFIDVKISSRQEESFHYTELEILEEI